MCTDSDISLLQPLQPLSAWTELFLFIVLLSRACYFHLLLDAVISVVLPLHDLTMPLSTYPLRL